MADDDGEKETPEKENKEEQWKEKQKSESVIEEWLRKIDWNATEKQTSEYAKLLSQNDITTLLQIGSMTLQEWNVVLRGRSIGHQAAIRGAAAQIGNQSIVTKAQDNKIVDILDYLSHKDDLTKYTGYVSSKVKKQMIREILLNAPEKVTGQVSKIEKPEFVNIEKNDSENTLENDSEKKLENDSKNNVTECVTQIIIEGKVSVIKRIVAAMKSRPIKILHEEFSEYLMEYNGIVFPLTEKSLIERASDNGDEYFEQQEILKNEQLWKNALSPSRSSQNSFGRQLRKRDKECRVHGEDCATPLNLCAGHLFDQNPKKYKPPILEFGFLMTSVNGYLWCAAFENEWSNKRSVCIDPDTGTLILTPEFDKKAARISDKYIPQQEYPYQTNIIICSSKNNDFILSDNTIECYEQAVEFQLKIEPTIEMIKLYHDKIFIPERKEKIESSPYVCSSCYARFKEENQCNQHIKDKHANKGDTIKDAFPCYCTSCIKLT